MLYINTSYLLLEEKTVGSINIKHFYMRRILRIWPLYFLVLFASIFTLYRFYPSTVFNSLPYYFLLMANVPFILNISLPLLGHYWSLGVEEQFYLFWPWLIKKTSNVFKVVLFFTVIAFMLRLFSRYIDYKYQLLQLHILSLFANFYNDNLNIDHNFQLNQIQKHHEH